MMRFGCQTYSWQMSFDKYGGRLDHICGVVSQAGFDGLEAEVVMLGDFASVDKLRDALDHADLQLAALTLVREWAGDQESEAEQAAADAAIALTSSFDRALLVLCQMPGKDRSDLKERQRRLLSCVAAIAQRAGDAGLKTAYHPNSPEGSLFRTSDDYEVLLDGLPPAVGFAPDLGHIARGGMDPVSVIQRYRDRVDHVHAKDMDTSGRWALIGSGEVPVADVAELLRATGYEGWFVLEDESKVAEQDPDLAARRLGEYVDEVLRASEKSRPTPPPVVEEGTK